MGIKIKKIKMLAKNCKLLHLLPLKFRRARKAAWKSLESHGISCLPGGPGRVGPNGPGGPKNTLPGYKMIGCINIYHLAWGSLKKKARNANVW